MREVKPLRRSSRVRSYTVTKSDARGKKWRILQYKSAFIGNMRVQALRPNRRITFSVRLKCKFDFYDFGHLT